MVKRITAAILLAVLLLLSACGEQNEAAAENDIRPQALKAAQAYRGLLPEGEVQDMQAILDCLKEQGYAAADVGGQYAFVHPEQVRAFFTAREDSREASCRFLRICWDGGLIDTHLNRREEEVSCRLLRVAWDGEEPMVTYDVEYPVSDCRLTDKDYLIFTCEIPDNIAESDHDGYVEPTTMLRLTPLDGTCRAWTEGLIGKIGYRGHALFTTDWKLEDMSAVSLNDLFPALYRAETGELLSYYENPWPTT